ncbi:MAG: hypothetical protein GF375_06770 [Candidatus Omnitrophica bacterium]|nr:hypothetical protein [Candidatus Omnitrophota bacterium]MBD3269678.1 hypothetical protein [Candidatus Omnitrophota bacterium]
MRRWTKGMRDAFFDSLFSLAVKDKNLLLLTSDTGAICHDNFREELSAQYMNVGIAEQNMIGVASGLALSGKKIYVYGIVPFVTMRCYEQIRIDLCCMDLNVTIVSIGAGLDYSTLGPTHHGYEDISLMRSLPPMKIYSPSDSLIADFICRNSYKEKGPKYIRLDRTGFPLLYKRQEDIKFARGFSLLKEGKDVCIIATGRIVYNALQAAKKLSEFGIDSGVIDIFRIKPINAGGLWEAVRKNKVVVVLEEHFLHGGLGSAVSEIISQKPCAPLLKLLGISDFCNEYGNRKQLQALNSLDPLTVAHQIKDIFKNGKK